MRVSFGHGFVRIPSRDISFNPDNVIMIHPNGNEKLCSLDLLGNGHIPNVNSTVSEVTKSCVLAQKLGETVDITEGVNLNISA